MSNNNSILPFGVASLRELQETAGITRFEGDSWNQVVGGLILQGGRASIGTNSSLPIAFPVPYPKKVLGIFTQGIYPVISVAAGENEGVLGEITLIGFSFGNDATAKDYYWWAIGF